MSKTSKTTGVSFEGDKSDVAAINHLAAEMGMTAGKFVADAIRKVHGAELEPIASFFRKRNLQRSRMTSDSDKVADHA